MITTMNSAYMIVWLMHSMIAGTRQVKDGKVWEIDRKCEWLRHMRYIHVACTPVGDVHMAWHEATREQYSRPRKRYESDVTDEAPGQLAVENCA